MERLQTGIFMISILVSLEQIIVMMSFIKQLIFLRHISDAPHLVKTARNCLFNSELGKHTRLMWNGKELIWSHIAQLYHSDMEQALHQLPKLTPDHINLTSFSKMKVSLAV